MLHYLRENRSWMQLLFMSDQKIFPPTTTVWLPHSVSRGIWFSVGEGWNKPRRNDRKVIVTPAPSRQRYPAA